MHDNAIDKKERGYSLEEKWGTRHIFWRWVLMSHAKRCSKLPSSQKEWLTKWSPQIARNKSNKRCVKSVGWKPKSIEAK